MKAWIVWADHGYEGKAIYAICLDVEDAEKQAESPAWQGRIVTEISLPCANVDDITDDIIMGRVRKKNSED